VPRILPRDFDTADGGQAGLDRPLWSSVRHRQARGERDDRLHAELSADKALGE
jgi:hypothetical protein